MFVEENVCRGKKMKKEVKIIHSRETRVQAHILYSYVRDVYLTRARARGKLVKVGIVSTVIHSKLIW